MTKRLAFATFLVGLFASFSALAAQRTITLAVQNMYCAACPHTVRASLDWGSRVASWRLPVASIIVFYLANIDEYLLAM